MELNVYKVTQKFKQEDETLKKSYDGYEYTYTEIAAKSFGDALEVVEENKLNMCMDSLSLTDKKILVKDKS